ncbi:MarR family transcriptional regulator [Reyranella sp. CPCC 100927]|uniref:MarR family transcriptional regulator n=1 Tax=Reyranella sp. CPCC 100927 TaxID=2599616 RepID=UPI002106A04C|nr:MarR family transcriptional regulator [Reyranella sp. CPCC 100927]
MMSRSAADKAALVAAVELALRRMSAQGVMISQAVANKVGLASTDLECLDIIYLEGPVTAGRLAAATGLTTGAITGLVDRLEKAGFARRRRDPDDRRKVLVEALPEATARIAPLYGALQKAMQGVYARYSKAELALILDFTNRCQEVAVQEIARFGEPPRSRQGTA